MRGRAAAVALPALVVVVLVTVVAIASTGSTGTGTNETRRPPLALYDTVLSLLLVAVLLGGVLFVYGLMQRKEIAREIASGRYRRASVVYLVILGLFVALTYNRMVNWEREPRELEAELSGSGQLEPPIPPDRRDPVYEPSFAWLPVGVVLALLVAAVVAYVLADRRARRNRVSRVQLGERLADALDDTLDDLRAEADPRRAIIGAYARLERALAASGTPRRASETADEYLARVLRDLEIEPVAAARLTELFTEAKFSQHALGPAMKEQAIDALVSVRDELRRAPDDPSRPAEDALAHAGAVA